MTTLTCPTCGTIDTPAIGPGSGGHHAAAHCRQCGRHLKWLPKPRPPYMNEVIVCGVVSQGPVRRQTATGKPMLTMTLRLDEPWGETAFRSFIPLVAYGRQVPALQDLAPDQHALVKGKLAWRAWEQDGKHEKRLEVVVWSLQCLPTPELVTTN